MDYEVSVSNNEKYIVVNVTSPMTVDLGRRCGIEATELGKRLHIYRYLFDLRSSPNVDELPKNYEFAYKDLDAFGFPRNARSALLTDAEDKTHDFLETLFINAGYVVRKFVDEESATSWLEE